MQKLSTTGRYIWYFLIYSFLGAVIETLYRLVTEHQLYGVHGFLHLPLFPIYGIGALLIIIVLGKHVRHVIPLFFLGALLATVVEFAAHFLIEVLFGERIWDYSSSPFNFQGRVSLLSSVGFGLAAVFLVHFIHPYLEKKFKRIPNHINIIIASIVIVVLLIDIISSVLERLVN